MSEAAERYLRLALRLARHDEGVVDAYFGPADVAESVENEEVRSPADLVTDAEALLGELDDSWLRDQVVGLRTVAGRIAGERLAYRDEVEACHGVRPERTGESALTDTFERLEQLLPGSGSLAERRREWERSIEVPATRVGALMKAVVEEARACTRDLVGLPEGEQIEVELVTDVPWLGYHDYLGDLRGLIIVNTDLPRSAVELLHLALHESYPGHHAERCLKDVTLVRDRGLLEETVVLVPTPQSLVSEGTAELAPEMLLDGQAGPAFEAIVRDLGIDLDLPHARAVERALEPLDGLQVDAALMLHEEGRPEAEVHAFLVRWGLVEADLAGHAIRFVQDPTSRTYAVCYPAGRERCRAYVAGDPDHRRARFRRLLTEQVRVRELLEPSL